MKKNLLVLPVLALLAASCHTNSKSDMLCRKWQEVSVENPQYEAAVSKEMANIDMLSAKDTGSLRAAYGTSNADSAKAIGKAAIARQRALQEEVVKGTWFIFNKDGSLQMHSPKGTDNVKWEMHDDRLSISKPGFPTKKEWKITHLSDTALHITANNTSVSFNVRFRAVPQ